MKKFDKLSLTFRRAFLIGFISAMLCIPNRVVADTASTSSADLLALADSLLSPDAACVFRAEDRQLHALRTAKYSYQVISKTTVPPGFLKMENSPPGIDTDGDEKLISLHTIRRINVAYDGGTLFVEARLLSAVGVADDGTSKSVPYVLDHLLKFWVHKDGTIYKQVFGQFPSDYVSFKISADQLRSTGFVYNALLPPIRRRTNLDTQRSWFVNGSPESKRFRDISFEGNLVVLKHISPTNSASGMKTGSRTVSVLKADRQSSLPMESQLFWDDPNGVLQPGPKNLVEWAWSGEIAYPARIIIFKMAKLGSIYPADELTMIGKPELNGTSVEIPTFEPGMGGFYDQTSTPEKEIETTRTRVIERNVGTGTHSIRLFPLNLVAGEFPASRH
ncbi:MAG: hypothetical protein K1X53_05680 [Candidatus Sumerlaeaceae bacterium]|nr:hypothetical protein [Candidatus Sumerlaeaceae bacterium]